MKAKLCEICGDPMPDGETMFKYHGYSGPCPKPPLKKTTPAPAWHDAPEAIALKAERDELLFALKLLYEDMLDYGRRNNLGGEDNHVFVVARVAIAKAEGGAV